MLANIICLFHYIVILFILTTPFIATCYPMFLILHITFSVCLMLHWAYNNDDCALTVLECFLRGTDKKESFTHKFISPVYNFNQNDFSKLCYIIVFTLMCISIYNLYHCEKFQKFYNTLKKEHVFNLYLLN